MFFDNLSDLFRILVTGPLAFAMVVIILRLSGKRTLAKMNAFDFIVTVALGSILASTMLLKNIPLAEGILTVAILALLQIIVAWGAQRIPIFEDIIKSEPRVLLRNGILDHQALREERVTPEEVKSAIREAGCGDISQIAAVFFETNGNLSVISKTNVGNGSSFPDGPQD